MFCQNIRVKFDIILTYHGKKVFENVTIIVPLVTTREELVLKIKQ